ncbi:hypothetical protein SLNSH_14500 [Alsobacter soli]|uniref:Uncharacterized protein n=1 Tax=Alsobacter soli TaxID=2109933 RepID=A0A2T1HRZ3_9HYPH|nr:hypothetical protein [Alsobacter soli]PSC04424.1 hypothetical protein SLNSH_14500 [Alsobacter soli]
MNDVGPEHFRTVDGAFCVRLMAAYGSEGVWNADGEEALVDDLPIDPELAGRLQEWQEAFDALEDRAAESDGRAGAALRAAWSKLAEDGLALARALKQALPDWTVLYVDPALAREAGEQAQATSITD